MHETPDIEIQGDEYEEQQFALADYERQQDVLRAMAENDRKNEEFLKQVAEEGFRFKSGDRVTQVSTGRSGKVVNAVNGVCVTYGVIMDDYGYAVVVDGDLEEEINSCDALRIIDSVPYVLYHARLNQTYANANMTPQEAQELNDDLDSGDTEARWVKVTVDGQ